MSCRISLTVSAALSAQSDTMSNVKKAVTDSERLQAIASLAG
jgi:hypothetical protein